LFEGGVVAVATVVLGRTGEIMYAQKRRRARMHSSAGDDALHPNTHSNMTWIDGKSEHAAKTMHDAVLRRRDIQYREPADRRQPSAA
jgi:hypothetical protein